MGFACAWQVRMGAVKQRRRRRHFASPFAPQGCNPLCFPFRGACSSQLSHRALAATTLSDHKENDLLGAGRQTGTEVEGELHCAFVWGVQPQSHRRCHTHACARAGRPSPSLELIPCCLATTHTAECSQHEAELNAVPSLFCRMSAHPYSRPHAPSHLCFCVFSGLETPGPGTNTVKILFL